MVTAKRSDEARRAAFAKAARLEAAREPIEKLTEDECQIIYVELETRLAHGATNSAALPDSAESTESTELELEPTAASETSTASAPIDTPVPIESEVLPWMEAKRRAEAAFERDYLSRLMTLAKGKVTDAARLAGVERCNFRKLLQRNGLRPRKPKLPTKIEHASKYTDRITTILDENAHGLRTCEIAEKIGQAINFAFGILKSLERQARVERHGNRYNTLWTLPGVQPVPRVETVPAAAVAVLSNVTEPMDSRRFYDEVSSLLRSAGQSPSKASLKRGISRLISTGVLAHCGANEHGPMYVLASKGDTAHLN